jgi:redox-sensitive bicupin YhaK (pirin superfamily)
MINRRPAAARGHTHLDWLDSRHTFSFGDYYDPNHMGVGPLRVINDDRVAQGAGFPTHPHRDMEILTWVIAGALEHRDSLGTGSVIHAGELQRMSAGTGITHSEFNASATAPVHFLQIWILPDHAGLEPSYDQRAIPDADHRGRLGLIASRDGRGGSVVVHRDADVYACTLGAGDYCGMGLRPQRLTWVQVTQGRIRCNGLTLDVGDGAQVVEEPALVLRATTDAQVLVFDLAG